MKRITLLGIDIQNDFMDHARAALPVPGATADAVRTAVLINRLDAELSEIILTEDTHTEYDIGHSIFWTDPDGNNPSAGTIISNADVEAGRFTPADHALRDWALYYTKALEESGKYQPIIWPPHCIENTWGHMLQKDVAMAVQRWMADNRRTVGRFKKGQQPLTENYGAIAAEVPMSDPRTQVNEAILDCLRAGGEIIVAGQALPFCVKATIEQIAEHIGEEHIAKFVLLTDCMSSLPAVAGGPDFPAIGQTFLQDMVDRGMRTMKSTAYRL